MKIIVFDLKGKIAHFRRPDTTGAHLSYPIIPRTVVHGLIASILGQEKLEGEAWIGIQLLSPVKTRSQELSMLGKGWVGGGGSFNRPTSVELVIEPHYRIFYSGEAVDQLEKALKNRRSIYHTYLGSAYCLTFPRYQKTLETGEVKLEEGDFNNSLTVLPAHAIKEVKIEGERRYGRVGGIHYEHLGERCFQGTINIIYEQDGRSVFFKPKEKNKKQPFKFVEMSKNKVICLW